MLNTLKTLLTPIKHLIDRKVDRDKVYLKDETYSKDEVYPKSKVYTKNETYSKDQVYSKDEAYSRDEVYSKDETYSKYEVYPRESVYTKSQVYTKNEVYSKDEISPVAISGSYDDLNNTPTIPEQLPDLKNYAFNEVEFTWDGDTSGRQSVYLDGYRRYKISDDVLLPEEVDSIGYTYKGNIFKPSNVFIHTFDGGVVTQYGITYYCVIVVHTPGTYSIKNQGGTTSTATFVEPGIYVHPDVTNVVIKKIDKYKVEVTNDGGIQITNEETGETRKLAFADEITTNGIVDITISEVN